MVQQHLDAPWPGDPAGLRRVHFTGIGGAGMSALAVLLLERGVQVSGTDARDSATLADLRARGAQAQAGHDMAAIPGGTDLLVISSAVPEDNPEVIRARATNLPVIKRAALLGALMRHQPTLAVAGSHGKTTTSTLLAWILQQAGASPSWALGGEPAGFGAAGHAGTGTWLVAEADEFDGSLRFFQPAVAIVTNVEPEHLDYYGTEAALLDAFAAFLVTIPPDGLAILCADDPNTARLAADLRERVPVTTYGLAAGAAWQVLDAREASGGYTWTLRGPAGAGASLTSPLPGLHNVANASAAFIAARHAGLEPDAISAAIATFPGARRRFEVRGQAGGVTVIDDYGHHPTEVAATLAAARQRFPGQPVVVAFQPHLFSRTHLLLDDFARVLATADAVVVYDIYPAREENRWGIHSRDLVERTGPVARYGGALEDGVAALRPVLPRGEGAVITLGAGPVDGLVPAILEALA